MNQQEDTIIALATAQGNGAIALIRLSGNDVLAKSKIYFQPKSKKEIEPNKVYFGILNDENKNIIDEVLFTYFKSPASYTGEDSIEISCHNSNFIIQKILKTFYKSGIRLAKEGEFTQRAFLNGKLDLAQAEAVADLIASETQASHEIALNQLRGGISSELKNLREKLIHFTALIELELDFSEEDVEFADRKELMDLISTLQIQISNLIQSFEYGNAIKNGIPVAIVGKPNAGKSTLLNVLLKEERAIVSDIAGTTRDTIEEKLTIEGIDFRFIDTAGIRETDDKIETLGIQKAYEKAKESKIVLYLIDKDNTTKEEVFEDYKTLAKNNNYIILCFTKLDKYPEYDWKIWKDYIDQNISSNSIIKLSSHDPNTINRLKNTLSNYILSLKENIGNYIIVNQRHLEALQLSLQSLNEVENGFKIGLTGDLLAFHLRDSLKYLGTITGNVDVDKDILGTIFGKFCIGK